MNEPEAITVDRKEWDRLRAALSRAQKELAEKEEQLCRAREAIQALLTMMARGGKPHKLDDALSWVQNDQMAQEMALDALSSTAPCRHAAIAAKVEDVEGITGVIQRNCYEGDPMVVALALRDYLKEGGG